MNKFEISEIRRRLNPDDNNVTRIRGCYVNEKREIVSVLDVSPISLPQEETEKYLAAFKKALSGVPGKNLVDLVFTAGQVMEGEEHALLMRLRDSALSDDEAVRSFFERVIGSVEVEGNYLILLMHDAYDVPYHAKDSLKVDDASETVFSYVLACVCPVKLTKPALSYFARENEFHARELEWVVTSPETGFLFPSFDDRASNIYGALYYTRDAAVAQDAFVGALFGTDTPMPAEMQKEAFQAVLEDTLKDECDLALVKAINEQIGEKIEAQKTDKEAPGALVSRRDIRSILTDNGVSEERAAEFDEKFQETFGQNTDLMAVNLINEKQIEVRTPNVLIRVSPDRGDLIETRVIDGVKYVLVRADEGVEVNGVSIAI